MCRRGEACEKGVALMRWLFQLSAMMVAIGGEAPEVASPAAAVLARRASRAVLPEQMKVAAADDSSDVIVSLRMQCVVDLYT